TVSSELSLPLIECLTLFDASTSTIQPRSLIETTGGWSRADMTELRQFVVTNYTDISAVDWKIVGAYLNGDALKCQHVVLGIYTGSINDVVYRRICDYRES
ncbi:hypothetical protein IWW38_003762, partial [Coemansia aciculifera]